MNKLRSHTVRLTVIVLVCAGFGLYTTRPAHAEQSSQSFARWFGSIIESDSGAELQEELDDFAETGGQFGELLSKASQIVSRYDDEFGFSFAESSSLNVSQLLLFEWSRSQNANEMAGVPLQSAVKLLTSLHFDVSTGLSFFAAGDEGLQLLFSALNMAGIPPVNLTFSIVPMSSGIAICAP